MRSTHENMEVEIVRWYVNMFSIQFNAIQHILGISGRAQILFMIVFICRYLDLFTNYVSLYNSLMKVCERFCVNYSINKIAFL